MRFAMSRAGPFMRHTSLQRGEIVTDGATRLMALGGVPAVTLRTLADEFRITPQAVRQWFGGTDEMWKQIVQRFGMRWVASLTDPWRAGPVRVGPLRVALGLHDPGQDCHARAVDQLAGLHHLLPLSAEDIAATRAWLAITQFARDNAATAEVLSGYEDSESDVIATMAERSQLVLGALELDLLVAAVRGLRHAVCATQHPMALARAHAVLDLLVDRLGATDDTSAPNSFN